jgi:hypothetical protein
VVDAPCPSNFWSVEAGGEGVAVVREIVGVRHEGVVLSTNFWQRLVDFVYCFVYSQDTLESDDHQRLGGGKAGKVGERGDVVSLGAKMLRWALLWSAIG